MDSAELTYATVNQIIGKTGKCRKPVPPTLGLLNYISEQCQPFFSPINQLCSDSIS